MKTDCSYFAGKSGVLYFRTTIQRQEWTPFILGAEDLKKTKQNLSDLQEKKKFKNQRSLWAFIAWSDVWEVSAQHGVLRLPLQMCCLITSTFVLERDNEFITLQIAPDYHAVQRTERRASRRVSIRGFKRCALQKKKKVRNPPPSRIF